MNTQELTLTDQANSNERPRDLAQVVIQVNQAFRQFIQQKIKHNKSDLTVEMLQVLSKLWEKDGINQQELANATLKDKASLVYLIDNLTRRELVTRQEDTLDRRNKLIFLTKKGTQLEEEMSLWQDDMYVASMTGIDEQDVDAVISVLQRIITNLSC